MVATKSAVKTVSNEQLTEKFPKGKTLKYKLYVADTENNVPRSQLYDDVAAEVRDDYANVRMMDWSDLDKIEAESATRAWATALCPVKLDPSEADVIVRNSMHGFMTVCKGLPSGSKIAFHNLAYDGPLIMTYLLRMGYRLSDQKETWKKPAAGTFVAMITDTGVWYSLKVTFHHGNKCVEFTDSLKILPFSLDSIGKSLGTKAQKLKGTIDYQIHRPVGYEPTLTELRYIQNDVLVMAEALALLRTRETDLTASLTIGAACMTEYKKMLGAGDLKRGRMVYDHVFVELDDATDHVLRQSYRGGWCYVNRQNPLIDKNQILDLRASRVKGQTYDVNSLYPSAMFRKKFPVGQPMEISPQDFDPNTEFPFIIKLAVDFTVKKDHVPFIQLKGSSRFAENDYPRDSEGTVELTLTAPDYELFLEQYDIHQHSVLRVWYFQAAIGLFDEYIAFWYEIKATATNPVDRMIAKLMLNNLYGKMAQSMIRNSGVPYLDENGVLRLEVKEGTARGGYIPVGSYITAYARAVTVRAAQANYAAFLYADTDSIHLVGDAVGIPVGEELGDWDHEATWDIARFVRQKTYIERITAESKKGQMVSCIPKIAIKAAGATQLVKERLRYDLTTHIDGVWSHTKLELDELDKCTDIRRTDTEIFERFAPGLVEAGKFRRLAGKGGAMLAETTFRIHPPEGTYLDPVTGIAPPLYSVVA